MNLNHKKNFFFLIITTFLFFACNEKKEDKNTKNMTIITDIQYLFLIYTQIVI